MSLLPLADCARLLGIHPKTLRQWLKQEPLELTNHPRDALIKCLTLQQVEQVAAAHDRPCPFPWEQTLVQPDAAAEIQAPEEARTAESASGEEASLSQKLSLLETRMAQLSEQVAHLTLALLQERERTVERRLSDLETMVQGLAGRSTLCPAHPVRLEPQTEAERVASPLPTRRLIEAEQRVRSRMPPLIEYSAQATYVVVSSLEGELSLVPDSAEWFDWLATVSSFRFVGKSGRFTAYREADRKGPTRSWTAHRSIHQQRYKLHIGVTDRLTIAWLEQVAAKLQPIVDAS